MKFLEIVEKACRENIDCDSDGNVDGHEFVAEQVVRDMAKSRFKIVDRNGRVINLTELKK